MRNTVLPVVMLALSLVVCTLPAAALQGEKQSQAQQAIQRGLAFLADSQAQDGSWSPQPGPAVTGLALRAFLQQPGADATEPTIAKALAYLLARTQADGSIRDGAEGILANYNTAIAVSALTKLPQDAEAQAAVQRGVAFLRGLQWQHGMPDPKGTPIDEAHPFYGGAGYGQHGRPDLSNTQIMLQALHDAGVPADDPAFQRALTFITRLQGTAANDYYPQGTIVQDGGIIYATSVNSDTLGIPQSMANPDMIDEARAGRPVSGLRGYGSMTYAGFMSYLYADLKPDDPRVHDALTWIRSNYTLERNPGMAADIDQQGLFYYYLVHGRALAAFGSDTLATSEGDVDWRANLIDALLERQNADGSWANAEPRWMEADPNLVTAYAILTLQEAVKQ